jgi:Galactose oxidase, central domain/Kelch motif
MFPCTRSVVMVLLLLLLTGFTACSVQALETAPREFLAENSISTAVGQSRVLEKGKEQSTILPDGAVTPRINDSRFIKVGPMTLPRAGHTATLLGNGKALILGGIGGGPIQQIQNTAEMFDPVSQTFSSLWPKTMTSPRDKHTATLLLTGNVLITGGFDSITYTNTAELFDPLLGEFRPLPSMASARWGHTATLLQDGTVLIVGGRDEISAKDTAELFDPATGTFTGLPPMISRRYEHSATLLPDGRVLIAGGSTWNGGIDSITKTAELFDPVSRTFASLMPATMTRARDNHTATLLPNGQVLIAGGYNGTVTTNTAEIFDPTAGTFALVPYKMTSLRANHTATLLANNKVLIAGGGSTPSKTAELFDPLSVIFRALPSMISARWLHTATLLANGKVLLTGGTPAQQSEDLFEPGLP